MTVEPMDDAELAALRHIHQREGLSTYPPGNTAFDRLFARLDAERTRADAAEARALPEPRLLRTVEEVEALPRGHYLVRLAGETRTRAFDRCGFYPGWEETGDRLRRGNANFVGAWISGPLSFPDLPTPTAAQETPDAG